MINQSAITNDQPQKSHISRMRIGTTVVFFTVQSNGASVVGKGEEEKFNFLTK
jgi:hypothetical protein